jgi:metal-responsive CopG/Arc/MetJ family transcriptional regulator
MSAKELKEDEFRDRFDAGESLESLGFDLDKGVLDEPQVKRVNVDFPDAIVAKLDRYCALMGITRQSLIKVWIFERLKEEAAQTAIEAQRHGSLAQTVVGLGRRGGAKKTVEITLAEGTEDQRPAEFHPHVKKKRSLASSPG